MHAIVYAFISYYTDSKPYSSELLISNTSITQTRFNRPLHFQGLVIKSYTIF